MTTKVHAVTDGLGDPLRFLLSSGNHNDICMAQTLLGRFDLRGKLILADNGYDSGQFVRWVEERGGIVVIPSRVVLKQTLAEKREEVCRHEYSSEAEFRKSVEAYVNFYNHVRPYQTLAYKGPARFEELYGKEETQDL